MLVTNPIPEEYSMPADVINQAIDQALEEAKAHGIHGKETTPFLLAKVKELTGGDSLDANIQLVFNNARLAAAVAGGPADYGFGAEAAARQVDGVDFLPLQLEWYDLVLPTARRDEPAFRAVLDFVTSAQFRRELARTGHYDLSQTGRIFEL